jgi:hypothetical protein
MNSMTAAGHGAKRRTSAFADEQSCRLRGLSQCRYVLMWYILIRFREPHVGRDDASLDSARE